MFVSASARAMLQDAIPQERDGEDVSGVFRYYGDRGWALERLLIVVFKDYVFCGQQCVGVPALEPIQESGYGLIAESAANDCAIKDSCGHQDIQ